METLTISVHIVQLFDELLARRASNHRMEEVWGYRHELRPTLMPAPRQPTRAMLQLTTTIQAAQSRPDRRLVQNWPQQQPKHHLTAAHHPAKTLARHLWITIFQIMAAIRQIISVTLSHGTRGKIHQQTTARPTTRNNKLFPMVTQVPCILVTTTPPLVATITIYLTIVVACWSTVTITLNPPNTQISHIEWAQDADRSLYLEIMMSILSLEAIV